MARGKGKTGKKIATQSVATNKIKVSKGKVTVDMTKRNGNPNKLDSPTVLIPKSKRTTANKATKQASTNKEICLDASVSQNPANNDWEMAETNNVTAEFNDEDTVMDMAVGDADNEFLSDGEIPPQPEQQFVHMETQSTARKSVPRERSRTRSRSKSVITSDGNTSSETDTDSEYKREHYRSRARDRKCRSSRSRSRKRKRSRSRSRSSRRKQSVEQRLDDISRSMLAMQQMIMHQNKPEERCRSEDCTRAPHNRGRGKVRQQLNCTIAINSPAKNNKAKGCEVLQSVCEQTIYKNALEQMNVDEFNQRQKEHSLGQNRFSSSSSDEDMQSPNQHDINYDQANAFIAECEAEARRGREEELDHADSGDERHVRSRSRSRPPPTAE